MTRSSPLRNKRRTFVVRLRGILQMRSKSLTGLTLHHSMRREAQQQHMSGQHCVGPGASLQENKHDLGVSLYIWARTSFITVAVPFASCTARARRTRQCQPLSTTKDLCAHFSAPSPKSLLPRSRSRVCEQSLKRSLRHITGATRGIKNSYNVIDAPSPDPLLRRPKQ